MYLNTFSNTNTVVFDPKPGLSEKSQSHFHPRNSYVIKYALIFLFIFGGVVGGDGVAGVSL